MRRHTVIATYTATTETRTVYVHSDGHTADAPFRRPQVLASAGRSRPHATSRARRALLAVFTALAASALRALMWLDR